MFSNQKQKEYLEKDESSQLSQINQNQGLIGTINSFSQMLCNSMKNLDSLQEQNPDANELKDILNQVYSRTKSVQQIVNMNEAQLKDLEKLNTYVPEIERDKYGYDLMIEMKSVFDLQRAQYQNISVTPQPNHTNQRQRGLSIQFCDEKKHLQHIKNQTIVGMQGLRNKGKTFILNSLVIQEFPSGYNVSTPGICLKFHSYENKNITYIDSEGLSCPIVIDFDNNENYQKLKEKLENDNVFDQEIDKQLQNDITNKHLDQKVTEQLQQDFIIQSSHILILVVSNLTQDDQKLIHTISQQLSEDKKQKEIYVVHNLKETHLIKEVEKYIESLKKIYPIRELPIPTYDKENENNTIFVDCINKKFNHLVMANSNSQAGRYYNQFTLEYIKKRIAMCKEVINFNAIERLQTYFNDNLQNFVLLKRVDGKEIQGKQSYLKYDEEKNSIFLKEEYKIEKIKELSVNVFGFLQKDCLYSIYNKDDSRILIVEVPGYVDSKFAFYKKKGIFEIRSFTDANKEKENGTIFASTRKLEDKVWSIPICKDGQLWNYVKEKQEDLKNGLYKFVFIRDEDVSDSD